MGNILLTAILGLLLLFGLAGFIVFRRVKASYEALKATIYDYVTPTAPGQPSRLAIALDLYGQMLARSMVAQVKTTLAGTRSGEVRADGAEQDAANQEKLAQLGLPGILAAAGGMRRTLRKNPGLLDLALPFIQTMMAGKGSGNGNHATESADRPRFKLGGG